MQNNDAVRPTGSDFDRLTPMMKHYLNTKDEHPDCLLFYRLGDFYEMFFEDAKIVSKELELTLTGKSCGLDSRAPMCGVPYHAVDHYLTSLVNRGFKVAICEQVEDPRTAKGMVKREVVRIVTPGTNIDTMSLDESKNNYLMSAVLYDDVYGIAFCDISTGDFLVTELNDAGALKDEIAKFTPSEILINDAMRFSPFGIEEYSKTERIALSPLGPEFFDDSFVEKIIFDHFKVKSMDALGLTDFPSGAVAVGAMLGYLRDTQMMDLGQLKHLRCYIGDSYMLIDAATARNLELVETMRDKRKQGSLLGVLDKAKTAMGSRLMRGYIEQPLIDKRLLNDRLDAVGELMESAMTRDEIREYLTPVYDLERLMTRIIYGTANPRDLISFKSSILMIAEIKKVLAGCETGLLRQIYDSLDPLEDIADVIECAIDDDPPLSVHDGDIIKTGFHEEVDHLREAKNKGKSWMAELEAKEREKTGIAKLRVRYNKVFGYYFEVTNSYKDMVPDYFIRKQTLTNSERFFTTELKEMENTILGATDKLTHLEHDLFNGVLKQICDQGDRVSATAKALAQIDVIASFAHVSAHNGYVRPNITTDGVINIKDGRHPVIERVIKNDMFVPNDAYLDKEDRRISIITGPNMAGKSTYMRQTALIVLMSQIGCFVPAASADIGLVDRIFTRVGASDDLASGQSTFMVEMNEVANILRSATENSLLILDEIGRGTSTFDGLAIAWAVVEHIANREILGAKALFATHYHELTELEGKLSGVNNYCIAVKENGDDIVFLRKIISGGADKSYGIQVAKLAGVPEAVTSRASAIVEELLENDIAQIGRSISVEAEEGVIAGGDDPVSYSAQSRGNPQPVLKVEEPMQMSLFGPPDDFAEKIVDEIQALDLMSMTPLEAMNTLNDLKKRIDTR